MNITLQPPQHSIFWIYIFFAGFELHWRDVFYSRKQNCMEKKNWVQIHLWTSSQNNILCQSLAKSHWFGWDIIEQRALPLGYAFAVCCSVSWFIYINDTLFSYMRHDFLICRVLCCICSVLHLQCVAVCHNSFTSMTRYFHICATTYSYAVCCSVLQCVAVCCICSVLQCVAVCCSVL